MEELHEMTHRIEKLSRAEHDLISDVHPQVSEIKEQVENVREVISAEIELSAGVDATQPDTRSIAVDHIWLVIRFPYCWCVSVTLPSSLNTRMIARCERERERYLAYATA